ncbi:hypothetical protein TUMSATVNIG1_60960 (plasmid) [Vibrio nigripulchritudo]|nr:hypothetical protein VNTUMSATTG_60490 [Vibrio nigripulchritudo]BDU35487.1 hypothetical protein TUMSATVNIG1_60960 [Vibrio nigripulchritudo]
MKTYEGGLWLPEGFFDGPSEDDLALHIFTMIFGLPVTNIYNSVFSENLRAPHDASARTLATAYGAIMNSVGMIIIFTAIIFSSIAFMGKRSIDVNYLTPQKEDAMPFVLVRGAASTILTFPVPMLGGLSGLQGFTIVAILFGLGTSSAMIKYSAPYILSPGLAYYSYPQIDKLIDHVLEAKTCSYVLSAQADISFSEVDSRGYTDDSSISAPLHYGYSAPEYPSGFGQIKTVSSSFGPPNPGTGKNAGECGKVVISEYSIPSNLTTLDLNDYSMYLTKDVMGQIISTHLRKMWSSEGIYSPISSIASKLTTQAGTSSLSENTPEGDWYGSYNEMKRKANNQIAGEIISSIRGALKTDLEKSMNSSSQFSVEQAFIDDMASIGFMGLGSYYMGLNQRQVQINEIMANAPEQINKPAWTGTRSDSIFSTLLGWFSDPDEEVEKGRVRVSQFLLAAESKNTNPNPKQKLKQSMDFLTDDGLSSGWNGINAYIASELINVFRVTENGMVFPNPIAEMRTVGNTIQNAVLAVGAIAIGSQFVPVADQVVEGALSQENFGGRLLSGILAALFGLGFFYAQIVPNLPYIMWSIAVFSYISYSVISVIGAGWWGAGMTLGDERNLSGRAKDGANILLTLCVRPMLMTVSFFVAMPLNIALGMYAHTTIEMAANSAFYGGLNVLGFFGALLINGIIITVGVMKNLSLIWEMTDMMMNFLSFPSKINDSSHNDAQSQSKAMSSSLSTNFQSVMQTSLRKPSFAS